MPNEDQKAKADTQVPRGRRATQGAGANQMKSPAKAQMKSAENCQKSLERGRKEKISKIKEKNLNKRKTRPGRGRDQGAVDRCNNWLPWMQKDGLPPPLHNGALLAKTAAIEKLEKHTSARKVEKNFPDFKDFQKNLGKHSLRGRARRWTGRTRRPQGRETQTAAALFDFNDR